MGETDYRLGRFVLEQNEPSFGHDTYNNALQQLKDGHKCTHWMWYVFPQLDGIAEELGLTPTSVTKKFAITSLDEAVAYLAHPVLGPNLRECTDSVLASPASTAIEIFKSSVDTKKLKSCMTLFLRADPEDPRYQAVLDKYFEGKPDPITDRLLGLA